MLKLSRNFKPKYQNYQRNIIYWKFVLKNTEVIQLSQEEIIITFYKITGNLCYKFDTLLYCKDEVIQLNHTDNYYSYKFGTLLYCKDEVIQLNHTDIIIISYEVKKQLIRRLSKLP